MTMNISGSACRPGVPRPAIALVLSAALAGVVACGGGSGGGGGSGSTGPSTDGDEPVVLRAQGHFGFSAASGDPHGWLTADVADLTGDGREELLIYTAHNPLVQQDETPFVVFGERNREFVNITDEVFPGGAPTAQFNREVLIADFNGDGVNDIFLSNHGEEVSNPFPGEQNRLYLSNDQGQLIDSTDLLPEASDFSHGSTFADIDGDGELEIFVNNLSGGEPSGSGDSPPYLLKRAEDGAYDIVADYVNDMGTVFPSELQNAGAGFYTQFIDLGDDGAPHLWFGPVTDGSPDGYFQALLRSQGDGTFTLTDPETLPLREIDGFTPVPEDTLTADLNGNGLTDMIAFERYGDFKGGYYAVYMNQGDGTFTDETEARFPGQDFSDIEIDIPRPQIVDLNGDGHLDFIARGFDFGTDPDGGTYISWIYLNDGNGFFERQDPADYPDFRPGFAVLDANGDGILDIVTEFRDFISQGESYVAVYYGGAN